MPEKRQHLSATADAARDDRCCESRAPLSKRRSGTRCGVSRVQKSVDRRRRLNRVQSAMWRDKGLKSAACEHMFVCHQYTPVWGKVKRANVDGCNSGRGRDHAGLCHCEESRILSGARCTCGRSRRSGTTKQSPTWPRLRVSAGPSQHFAPMTSCPKMKCAHWGLGIGDCRP